MDDHYPTISEPATADYVLSVLRDEHLQNCRYNALDDPDISLSFETTVAEWREECDLIGGPELGQALNREWGIACSAAEWRAVLKPYHLRRLSDVCELIARHATRQRIRPARLLGSECTSAGAFLTIRSLLRQEGANVEGLAPSTSLAEYAMRHAGVFLGPISRLAPGCMPPVTVHATPLDALALWGMLVGLLCTLAGSFIGVYPLTLFGVPLLGLSFLLSWASATCIPPTSVEFGELRTFRDLAVAMSRSEAA